MAEANLYQCKDCGLHYDDKATAKECYDFCTKNYMCSIEITKKSEEHKALVKTDADPNA